MIGIYKITNKANGKSYIGQSIHCGKRLDEHCKGDQLIDQTIQIEGVDNFTFEILKEANKNELSIWEDYYIIKYDTMFPNGYNKKWNCSEELRNILFKNIFKKVDIKDNKNSYTGKEKNLIETAKVLNDRYLIKERITSFKKLDNFYLEKKENIANRNYIQLFINDLKLNDNDITYTMKKHLDEIKYYVELYNNGESFWRIEDLFIEEDMSFNYMHYGVPIYDRDGWIFKKDRIIKQINFNQKNHLRSWSYLIDKGILSSSQMIFYSTDGPIVYKSLLDNYKQVKYFIIQG